MRTPLLPLAAAALLVGGCADDASPSEAFCQRLAEEQVLVATEPGATTDLDDLVDAYRSLEDEAPLAISDDWRAVADLVEAALTVDVADAAAVDDVRARAIATSQSIERVSRYATEHCGVDLDAPAALPDGSPPAVAPSTSAGTLPPSSG